MKRTIRTEEQIIGILQEHEAGAKCADLCRKHGMSEGTCLSLEGEVFRDDGVRGSPLARHWSERQWRRG
jgi:hypothetical protein